MRILRVWGLVYFLVGILAGTATPPAFGQPVSEADLDALYERGTGLYHAGKYDEAISIVKTYAAGVKARYGESSSNFALALNNLAVLLKEANRLAEAEPLMRRALAIDEKSHGPDHPDVARDINNLAALLDATKRFAEAEPLYRRALDNKEKSLGPDHPDVALALNNLAALLHATNRLSEAEPLMRRALAIDEKAFGPNHPTVASRLNNLAALLEDTSRFAEAEPLYRRALEIREKSLGPDHPDVALTINNLSALLQATNRPSQAEPLMRRVVSIFEKSLGPDHPNVATALNNLAQLLCATNRNEEAESLMRRALAIDEKSLGLDHTDVARDLGNLAELLKDTNRLAQAEPLMRRALAIDEKRLGPNHPDVARDVNNIAGLFLATNRLAEAEPLYRRTLVIVEKSYGPHHPLVAKALQNLAALLSDTYRFAQAEPLMRRALAIDEKSLGPNHPEVALTINNLAELLKETNRLAEAEPLYRRALGILEKSIGADHPKVATPLNNLAELLKETNRFAEAEPLYRRALGILEKSLGPDHPNVALALNNLALLLIATNRLSEAEPLYRRALAIVEKSLGPDHPDVARVLDNLAALCEEQQKWEDAAALYERAKPIMIGLKRSGERETGLAGKLVLGYYTGALRASARALYRAKPDDAASLAEGFELAQWALQSSAADALSSMAVRFAKGDAGLAKFVREEQDLLHAREAVYRSLDQAAGKADAKAAEAARFAIAQLQTKLVDIQARIRAAFPDYAELSEPKPLSLKDTQALLRERQALVLFLDVWQNGKIPGETLVFVLTKTEARWASIKLSTTDLALRVSALRCGLDRTLWSLGQQSREDCKRLLGTQVSEFTAPPFDAALAHGLYRDLFGSVEDAIKDKSLLIVPSGALTQLPFEVLVTEKPNMELPRFDAYRKAAWFGQRQAITVLPSVGSLKALRTAKASPASTPFIGFGNPLLDGQDGRDKSAWARQTCVGPPSAERTGVADRKAGLISLVRNGQPSPADLCHQPPLPETADELCEVARTFWLPESALDSAVYLGERATVSRIKALSRSGELARARVIHFATHGLIAGQTAMFAKNKAEPALVLTPPAADEASEEDNGLLTASEVAQLNLNADWVVMSACNTAAGSSEGAEALSGLARAFFYAGARALLVSHWAVDSDAAVAITTGAMNAMNGKPQIGRAEALRRSITALIGKGGRYAHPSVWGPFTLVGNGEQ